jgi:hypothetical protein
MRRHHTIAELDGEPAEPHVFDQTNGVVDLGSDVEPEVEDPRNVRRRESSEQAAMFSWGASH